MSLILQIIVRFFTRIVRSEAYYQSKKRIRNIVNSKICLLLDIISGKFTLYSMVDWVMGVFGP
jgi:hypothetical protein